LLDRRQAEYHWLGLDRVNLFYLFAKKNQRLARSRNVAKFRVQRHGLTWRGVKLESGAGSIYLEKATECQPFRSRASCVGWYAMAIGGDTEIALRFMIDGKTVGKRRIALISGGFEPIVLPWPVEPLTSELDLELYCSGPFPAFIASHFDLDRNVLFDRCKGNGVELGPGPNPHIRPSDELQVIYVEQKAPDEWVSLYGDHYKVDFDPFLKPFYVVGDAHKIPAEPASLDFIYSSHVFEHLVNPLGHLEIWSRLLRKGGEVLMVIPDYIGSKDYLVEASSLDSIIDEYRERRFSPTLRHYETYGRARNSPHKARSLYDSKTSIHMHYYSNENMSALLQYSIDQGYFGAFSLIHVANAKDFHVILVK
jgi:predicted SAM-dependent methyltransferase